MPDTAALRNIGIVRRAKPLLGTLVDIGVGATDVDFARTAVEAAFAEIREVHRLMSFHEPPSDVSRINRAAPGVPVEVDPRTADVLRLALEMQEASTGAFDCTVAPVLVRHRLLPSVQGWDGERAGACRRDSPSESGNPALERAAAFTVDACSVIKARDCLIDLGGIAKGYAVDRAIEAVTAQAATSEHSIDSVLVNAGGDLRFRGPSAVTFWLRDPRDAGRLTDGIEVSDGALASSSTSGLDERAHQVSPLVDPVSGTPLPMGAGVTVAAPTCAIADALTKVALTTRDAAHPVFARYRASVVRLIV